MSLIRLENIVKRFHGHEVLDGVNLRVEEGEKIGLIGRNGSGKSTLFKIMSGELSPDSGTVERMRRARIARLAQIPSVDAEVSIYDVVMNHFSEFVAQETRLRELEEQIAAGEESLLEEYGRLQEAFTLTGGYEFRAKVKRILGGLGFSENEFSLSFGALSGGQRTRLMLAVVLLEDADLLMLDEPENHLDLQASEWLEGFLNDWDKALVVISHDRRLLNAVTERTMEVERGQVQSFAGNYAAYQKEKARLLEEQAEQYKRQQEEIRREEAWINRFRYKATKAKQVQARIKRLDKMDRVEAPPPTLGSSTFRLGEVVRSGQVVLRAENLGMAYGDLVLYEGLSFQVERGERLGIIGANGSGKTTLLRQIAGELPAGYGTVELGHNCRMAVYDQHHVSLSPEREVLEELEAAYPDLGRQKLRDFLGRLLFTGEDVFKRIGSLSGGERSRVALAKIILSEANVLLLDEPTNHLDVDSREALEVALSEFPGSMILISHDRALLDRLVDKLIVLGGGEAEVFLGNYSHYKWKHDGEGSETEHADAREAMKIRQAKPPSQDGSREAKRARQRQEKRLEKLEESIESLEALIGDIEGRFAELDPTDYEPLAALTEEKAGMERDLRELYAAWEALSEELSSR